MKDPDTRDSTPTTIEPPRIDEWIREAKASAASQSVGMILVHNGVVRATSRDGQSISALELVVDREAERKAVERVSAMPGIAYVRVWINEGRLAVGDDIMFVVVAGDIREHVFSALQSLVGEIKSCVVTEREEKAPAT